MVILILLFKLSCDIYYRYSFSQSYSYYLFDYNFSFENYLISWLVTIIFSLRFSKAFKNKRTEKLSTYIIFILYLLSFIPTMTLCAYENLPVKFLLLVSAFWGITLCLEYYFCARRIPKKVNNPETELQLPLKYKKPMYTSTCLLVICAIIGFSYYYTGFKINLNLNDVYVLRFGEIRSLDGVMQYVYIWVGILVSVLGVYAFQKQKYSQFAVWLILLVLYYSIEGNKITLFIIPASLAAIFFKLKDRMWILPVAFILLNFCGILEPLMTGLRYINGYWGLRMLFLPSNLTHMYYDYFSLNGPDYWARSFLRHFGAVSKYDMDFGHIIDIVYFNLSGEGNANTGLFGSAYANFGDLCIIVYPCVMLCVFLLINWFTKSSKIEKCYVFLIYYAMALQNSDPFGVLMTNGLLVIGLLYKFILSDNRRPVQVKKFEQCVT